MKVSQRSAKFVFCALTSVSLILSGSGCTTSGSTATSSSSTIPLLTPIIKSAIPTGLGGTNSHVAHQNGDHALDNNDNGGTGPDNTNLAADIGNLQSRFFSSSGPTEIVGQLMPTLDSLITNINTMESSSTSACLTQTPVSYTITPAGQSVTMYAQCYVAGSASYTGDPAFTQFGFNNGIIYVYSAQGAEWVAAIVTPLTGGTYSVTAYLGVGYNNASGQSSGCSEGDAWDAGSYGLIELNANTSTGTFELATAGSGLGFCGAQLISNGTSIYAVVSNDSGSTCGTSSTNDDLCVSASSVTTASSTSCPTASNFTLYPMGRTGGTLESKTSANSCTSGIPYGASTYPSVPNVTFTGLATDSLHFGPIVPTTGVGLLTSTSSGGGSSGSGAVTQAQIVTALTGSCSISSGAANTAAVAALAASSQSAAITALNASLTTSGDASQTSCADTAVEAL